jgi:hypothetical protein
MGASIPAAAAAAGVREFEMEMTAIVRAEGDEFDQLRQAIIKLYEQNHEQDAHCRSETYGAAS